MTAPDIDPNVLSDPAPPPGDKTPGDTNKTYTEEELQQRLKGQGKQLEKQKGELEEFRQAAEVRKVSEDAAKQKQLVEEGKYKDLYENATTEKKDLEEKLKGIQERETARLERVVSENEKRTRALSKALQNLISPVLDADEVSVLLARLEALQPKKEIIDVHGGGGKGGGSGPRDPNEISADIGATIMGQKKPGGAS